MSIRALLAIVGAACAACAGCGGASTSPATEPEPAASAAPTGEPSGAEPAADASGDGPAAATEADGSGDDPVRGTVVLWCREGDGSAGDCEPPDEGLLEAKPLLSVLQQNESALLACVSDEPAVRVRVHIGDEGEVAAVHTPGAVLDAQARTCLDEAVRGWSFPAPERGEVVIEYPLGAPDAPAADAADAADTGPE